LGLLGGLFGKLFGKGRPQEVDAGDGASVPRADIKKFKPELLIIGLGNPGSKYDGTRHNVGFDVADEVCAALGNDVAAPVEYCEAMCRTAFCGSAGKPVLIAKPLTYMNLSGDSVGALVKKYGLSGSDSLIIVDDFHIPIGKLRFRKDGSPGGHNGLKSISAAIGPGYPRLRVGIGPLPPNTSVIDFVLGAFEECERDDVAKTVKSAAEAVAFMVDNGIDMAMNKYN